MFDVSPLLVYLQREVNNFLFTSCVIIIFSIDSLSAEHLSNVAHYSSELVLVINICTIVSRTALPRLVHAKVGVVAIRDFLGLMLPCFTKFLDQVTIEVFFQKLNDELVIKNVYLLSEFVHVLGKQHLPLFNHLRRSSIEQSLLLRRKWWDLIFVLLIFE